MIAFWQLIIIPEDDKKLKRIYSKYQLCCSPEMWSKTLRGEREQILCMISLLVRCEHHFNACLYGNGQSRLGRSDSWKLIRFQFWPILLDVQSLSLLGGENLTLFYGFGILQISKMSLRPDLKSLSRVVIFLNNDSETGRSSLFLAQNGCVPGYWMSASRKAATDFPFFIISREVSQTTVEPKRNFSFSESVCRKSPISGLKMSWRIVKSLVDMKRVWSMFTDDNLVPKNMLCEKIDNTSAVTISIVVLHEQTRVSSQGHGLWVKLSALWQPVQSSDNT